MPLIEIEEPALRCPHCGHLASRTYVVKHYPGLALTRRWKKCKKCRERFITFGPSE